MAISPITQEFMEEIVQKCGREKAHWAKIFTNCFTNTLETTVKALPDHTTYVLTGDIPAMWLRDSVAQVRPYLVLADKDESIRQMILGLVERQFQFILIDPYANAFNEKANGAGYQTDNTKMNDWIWERKYEIDSLCYPVQLAYLLYLQTGETSQFNHTFVQAVDSIMKVWTTELDHCNSTYLFTRDTWRKEDTLVNDGFGPEFKRTGMTWSGFRPSDDACIYSYLVPSNMFAVVVLGYLEDIFENILNDRSRYIAARILKTTIQKGIDDYALVKNAEEQEIFAYEVDGLGNASIMDDANVPSLLSAAYLGYCDKEDTTYLATRQIILSKENPYYYEGKAAKGIGSSHTPENSIWPIALAMEGLTATDKEMKKEILDTLAKTDAGTFAMHEGFNVDNPDDYTREWFSWANMMFCELLMDYFDIRIKINK
ncbi:MAG: glycoside hydrolase family 125 protein [Lactobacillales bacterium]|jgi:meiotically up-regulated gene 157 (Mug157) protein|nr:glycoside hydrolase family 125 protein [Lactobacillales bacterium]